MSTSLILRPGVSLHRGADRHQQLELDASDLQGRLAVVASGMTRHRDQAAIRIRNRYAGLGPATR